MKHKIIMVFPYVMVGVIILYLLLKYDAINRAEKVSAKSAEESSLVIGNLLTSFSSFDTLEKISFVADEEIKFEGKSSAKITKDNMFGPTFVCATKEIIKHLKKVEVSFMTFSKMPIKESSFVISLGDEKENVIYKNAAFSPDFKVNEWNKSVFQFDIDNTLLTGDNKIEFKSYVFNPKNEELYMDNFKIELLGEK